MHIKLRSKMNWRILILAVGLAVSVARTPNPVNELDDAAKQARDAAQRLEAAASKAAAANTATPTPRTAFEAVKDAAHKFAEEHASASGEQPSVAGRLKEGISEGVEEVTERIRDVLPHPSLYDRITLWAGIRDPTTFERTLAAYHAAVNELKRTVGAEEPTLASKVEEIFAAPMASLSETKSIVKSWFQRAEPTATAQHKMDDFLESLKTAYNNSTSRSMAALHKARDSLESIMHKLKKPADADASRLGNARRRLGESYDSLVHTLRYRQDEASPTQLYASFKESFTKFKDAVGEQINPQLTQISDYISSTVADSSAPELREEAKAQQEHFLELLYAAENDLQRLRDGKVSSAAVRQAASGLLSSIKDISTHAGQSSKQHAKSAWAHVTSAFS